MVQYNVKKKIKPYMIYFPCCLFVIKIVEGNKQNVNNHYH